MMNTNNNRLRTPLRNLNTKVDGKNEINAGRMGLAGLTSPSNKDDLAVREAMETLKHRLNQMDYKESFTVESMPLIQRLLADLIQTTDTARKFKTQAERVSHEKATLEEQIQPLRKEIARLTAENNQVHMECVRLADEKDARDRRNQQLARKAEAEISELKFMVSQYSHTIQEEQALAEQERKKVEDAFGKIGALHLSSKPAETTTAAGANRATKSKETKLFQKLQKIDIETGLEPLENFHGFFQAVPPATIDLLALSQARVEELELERKDLASKQDDLENEMQTLRDQLNKREEEIMRLGAQLELSRSQQFSTVPVSGRPAGLFRDEGAPIDPAESIHKLPIARQRIEQLELQIDALQDHIDILENERMNVEEEKRAFSEQLDEDKKILEEELERERVRSAQLLKATKNMENMVSELTAMRDRVVRESERLESHDSKRYQFRIQELEQTNLEKNAQIEQQQTALSALRAQLNMKPTPTPTSNNDFNDLERDHQNLKTLFKELELSKDLLERDLKTAQNHISYLSTSSKTIKDLENAQTQLSSERDRLTNELDSALKERDELMAVLSKFEQQLNEVLSSVEVLSSDREKLQLLLEKAESELALLREQNGNKPIMVTVDTSIQADPLEVPSSEAENKLKLKVLELESEISVLQTELKATVYRQREVGTTAAETIRQVESQRNSSEEALKKERLRTSELLEANNNLETSLQSVKSELTYQQKLSDELRKNLTVAETEAEKNNFVIRDLKSKYAESQSLLHTFQLDIDSAKSDAKNLQEKVGQYRELLAKIDGEQDHYRALLDEKSILVTELEDKIKHYERILAKTQEDSRRAMEQIDDLNQTLNAQDRELSALQKTLHSVTSERDRLYDELTKTVEDARNIGQDLAAMTKENQLLNTELVMVAGDRDKLQVDLSECENQIHYLNELIRSKDQEKDHLMSSYRKVISDNERFDVNIKSSSEEISSLRMEIIMRDKQVAQLQKSLDESNSDINRLKIDTAAYEKQNGNLTRSLATLERTCKHLEQEKSRLLREVAAVRELAQTLDRGRENTQRELATLTIESERLQKGLIKAEAEREALLEELRVEKLRYERMEQMIASERARSVQNERTALSRNTAEMIAATQRELQASKEAYAELESRYKQDLEAAKASAPRIPPVFDQEPRSPLETRLNKELESAKRQVQEFEREIEEHFQQ